MKNNQSILENNNNFEMAANNEIEQALANLHEAASEFSVDAICHDAAVVDMI